MQWYTMEHSMQSDTMGQRCTMDLIRDAGPCFTMNVDIEIVDDYLSILPN